MAVQHAAPTKSVLMRLKDQLAVANEGFELLEQKREILVMELMRMVEEVKILERAIERRLETAYPALKRLLLEVGRERAREVSRDIRLDLVVTERRMDLAGLSLPSLEAHLPRPRLPYSFGNSFADCDRVMVEFMEYLGLLTRMASLRTVVWRLAKEVKKTQRRVNALEKMVIPDTRDTLRFVEGILEEREREAFFVQKLLKDGKGGGS